MSFEQPIFAPPSPDLGRPRRPGRGCSCLVQALLATVLVAVLALFAAALCAQSAAQALSSAIGGCCTRSVGSLLSRGGAAPVASSQSPASTPAAGAATSGAAPMPAPPPAPAPVESASALFAQMFSEVLIESILRSWGVDRAAENARRLEWIAQSIREYQHLHGVPPPTLDALNVSRDDLRDVFGHPIIYRVAGSPPHWEVRSAGLDGSFDASDPWIAGP